MSGSSGEFAPISEIIEDVRRGQPVILVDDAGRENEGDLVVATEKITPEILNKMAKAARGLICVSISDSLASKLSLPLQVLNNNSPFNTPFTVSISHKDVLETDILAASRVKTMHALIADGACAADFVSPGSVFPLIANPLGVIARQGQTEGSYDLARLAGLKPSGVICEILNPDGTMARGEELSRFAREHEFRICSVAQIIRHRITQEILVKETAGSLLDTDYGKFRTYVFEDELDGKEHLALVYGDPADSGPELPICVRIHSECLTGDVLGSRRCDCGSQLDTAMRAIIAEGRGVILYLRQEGRGIGLVNKLKAYELQDLGHDTVEANLKLGFEADSREFAVAAKILSLLKIGKIRLMTNNPRKIKTLASFGVEVTERVALISAPDPYSRFYLETKKQKLGHLL